MEKQKVKDLQIDYFCGIQPNTSLEKAWDCMVEKNIKTLPVIDEDRNMIGLISMRDITLAYINDTVSAEFSQKTIPMQNILDTVDGIVLTNDREALSLGQIVFTADDSYDADEEETVIKSRMSEGTIERILIRSFPVEYWMKTKELCVVYLEDDVRLAYEQACRTDYRYYPVLDEKRHVVGVISMDSLYQQMK